MIKMIFELQSNFGYIGDIRRILPSDWQQKRPKLKPVLIFWRFRPSIAIIHDHSCSFMLIHIYSKLHSFQTQDILEPHPISRVVLFRHEILLHAEFLHRCAGEIDENSRYHKSSLMNFDSKIQFYNALIQWCENIQQELSMSSMKLSRPQHVIIIFCLFRQKSLLYKAVYTVILKFWNWSWSREEDTVSEVSFLKMRIEQIDKCRNWKFNLIHNDSTAFPVSN